MKLIDIKPILTEAAVSKKPQFKKISVNQAIDTLNKYCKDALWMLELNLPYYRAMDISDRFIENGFTLVDPSKTERKSQNTSNYYTVILDNHPEMKDFPKRSRSFIATTDRNYAHEFSQGNIKPYILIPFDNVKIGYVNKQDIWNNRIRIFGRTFNIEFLNEIWEGLGIKENIESFKKFSQYLKTLPPKEAQNLVYFKSDKFILFNPEKQDFMEEIFKAYSPKKLGFTVHTTATAPKRKINSEVWIGGPVVVITEDMWNQMRANYKK